MFVVHAKKLNLVAGEKILLEGVNFSIAPGETVCFSGPSGCGKTSLLLALQGLIPISSGQVTIGQSFLSASNIREIRRHIAFVSQEPFLGRATLEEAFKLPYTFSMHADKKYDRSQVVQFLERLGLAENHLAAGVDSLSGGEKQRAAIARALVMQNEILILDEPTTGLDDVSADAAIKTILEYEGTILSASHDTRWVSRCHRAFQFTMDGDLLENVTPAKVSPSSSPESDPP